MQQFRLKKGTPAFQVADGPFAGRKFEPGEIYNEDQVPDQEKARFEPVKSKPKPRSGKPARQAGQAKAKSAAVAGSENKVFTGMEPAGAAGDSKPAEGGGGK